jgi:hypothetical protein
MSDERPLSARAGALTYDVALQLAAQDGPLDIRISTNGSVTFNFEVQGRGGKLTCQYQAEVAAENLLDLFERSSNKITPNADDELVRAEAAQAAGATLWILLGFIRPRFSEALDDLFIESQLHAGRVLTEAAQIVSERQETTPDPAMAIMDDLREKFVRDQVVTVKKRIGARGRGMQRSFNLANVRRTAKALGNEANQESIAFRLGVSTRALRDLVKLEGFPSWKSFMVSIGITPRPEEKTHD